MDIFIIIATPIIAVLLGRAMLFLFKKEIKNPKKTIAAFVYFECGVFFTFIFCMILYGLDLIHFADIQWGNIYFSAKELLFALFWGVMWFTIGFATPLSKQENRNKQSELQENQFNIK